MKYFIDNHVISIKSEPSLWANMILRGKWMKSVTNSIELTLDLKLKKRKGIWSLYVATDQATYPVYVGSEVAKAKKLIKAFNDFKSQLALKAKGTSSKEDLPNSPAESIEELQEIAPFHSTHEDAIRESDSTEEALSTSRIETDNSDELEKAELQHEAITDEIPGILTEADAVTQEAPAKSDLEAEGDGNDLTSHEEVTSEEQSAAFPQIPKSPSEPEKRRFSDWL